MERWAGQSHRAADLTLNTFLIFTVANSTKFRKQNVNIYCSNSMFRRFGEHHGDREKSFLLFFRFPRLQARSYAVLNCGLGIKSFALESVMLKINIMKHFEHSRGTSAFRSYCQQRHHHALEQYQSDGNWSAVASLDKVTNRI